MVLTHTVVCSPKAPQTNSSDYSPPVPLEVTVSFIYVSFEVIYSNLFCAKLLSATGIDAVSACTVPFSFPVVIVRVRSVFKACV